jgi:hypothetical protein
MVNYYKWIILIIIWNNNMKDGSMIYKSFGLWLNYYLMIDFYSFYFNILVIIDF